MSESPQGDQWSERDQLEFARSAFGDAEATIRATDAKASIALVVHGFLFAGVVGVLSRTGSIFDSASGFLESTLIVLAVLIGALFLTSATQLIRSVTPSLKLGTRVEGAESGSFYIHFDSKWFSGDPTNPPSFEDVRRRNLALDIEQARDEMIAEWFKVSFIRARKVRLAKSGMQALKFEIFAVMAILAVIGIASLERIADEPGSSSYPAQVVPVMPQAGLRPQDDAKSETAQKRTRKQLQARRTKRLASASRQRP